MPDPTPCTAAEVRAKERAAEPSMSDTQEIPNCAYWDTDDGNEELSFGTIQEAIEMWAGAVFPDVLPETVTVYRFDRKQLDERDRKHLAERAVEDVLERLDEEYGDPNGNHPPDISEKMKDAANELVNAVWRDYTPWACEETCKVTVKVADYMDVAEYEAERAERLKEKSGEPVPAPEQERT